MRRLTNVLGVDDGPFAHDHRGDVPLVGVLAAGTRIEGFVIGRARRDGRNATRAIAELLERAGGAPHVRAILLRGITVAGFNVVDLEGLARATGRPVLTVMRRRPDLGAIREALLTKVPGGAAKWALVEAAPAIEPLGHVHVQRVGITPLEAERLLGSTTREGLVPEPLRVAHLVAGALVRGRSRGGG
ncbi:MAG: DUF99 family protein [Polyangiales bacterium]